MKKVFLHFLPNPWHNWGFFKVAQYVCALHFEKSSNIPIFWGSLRIRNRPFFSCFASVQKSYRRLFVICDWIKITILNFSKSDLRSDHDLNIKIIFLSIFFKVSLRQYREVTDHFLWSAIESRSLGEKVILNKIKITILNFSKKWSEIRSRF